MSKKDNKDKDNSPLVQARSENSVLFSLDALTQQPSSAPTASNDGTGNAQDDSSGFINLNAIASASQFVGSDDNQQNTGAPIIAPTMIPMTQEPQNNPIVYVSIGIAVILLFVVIALFAYVLNDHNNAKNSSAVATETTTTPKPTIAPATNKNDDDDGKANDDGEAVAGDDDTTNGEDDDSDDTTTDDSDDTTADDSDDTTADDAASDDTKKKLTPEQEAAIAKKKEEAERRRKEHEEKMANDPRYRKDYLKKQQERKERLAAQKSAAEKAAAEKAAAQKAAATPSDSKPIAKPKDDGIPSGGIGDIINDIEGRGKSKPDNKKPPETAAPPVSEGLSRTAIKSTVGRYYGRVKGCGGGDKSGTVMVRFSIQPNGTVGSAAITNNKKGTPEGGCVLGIVRSMKFPSFGGSAKTVNFPFRI